MKKLALVTAFCSVALWGATSASASPIDSLVVFGATWTPSSNEGSASPFPLSVPLPVANYTAVELVDPNTGAASDFVWVTDQYNLWFASDNNGAFSNLPSLNVVASLTETGAMQEIGGYFGVAGNSIQVQSGSAPAVTPLPAALPLFASGLGALGLLGWRRKRKAPAAA